MHAWIAAGPSVLASFLASLVEFVEALTIVLAVGIVRGWRPALLGAGAGVVLLTALVLAFGNSLTAVPLPILQFVVGTLLLLFGLRWLRKAVLRKARVIALHDEAKAFAEESERMSRDKHYDMRRLDKMAVVTSFKAVVLEGIEVVFIVIALGVGGRLLVPAAIGAALALATVLALGVWLHRPLSKVPENALKFGVGVMLAAFGTFWVAEGVGLRWPGEDIAVLYLMATFLAVALVLVQAGRRLDQRAPVQSQHETAGQTPRKGQLSIIGSELWGLFVDDGWLAAGIVAWSAGAWVVAARHRVTSASYCAAFVAGLLLLLSLSVIQGARARSRAH